MKVIATQMQGFKSIKVFIIIPKSLCINNYFISLSLKNLTLKLKMVEYSLIKKLL
jgi:hypothetical protein